MACERMRMRKEKKDKLFQPTSLSLYLYLSLSLYVMGRACLPLESSLLGLLLSSVVKGTQLCHQLCGILGRIH